MTLKISVGEIALMRVVKPGWLTTLSCLGIIYHLRSKGLWSTDPWSVTNQNGTKRNNVTLGH